MTKPVWDQDFQHNLLKKMHLRVHSPWMENNQALKGGKGKERYAWYHFGGGDELTRITSKQNVLAMEVRVWSSLKRLSTRCTLYGFCPSRVLARILLLGWSMCAVCALTLRWDAGVPEGEKTSHGLVYANSAIYSAPLDSHILRAQPLWQESSHPATTSHDVLQRWRRGPPTAHLLVNTVP
jgi:hypothetical protein